MPSAKKPEITNGQSLDVQPGVSNIGENQATLEALRNANIDGQDTYPKSVSTERLSSGDIDVSGMVRSGTMLVGTGGVTITSDADGGTPATGIHASASILQLIKLGVPQVTLNGSTGDATFIGAVTATSGTFTGTIQATAGYFVGSITIGTDTAIGTAATGTWLTNERLLFKSGGVVKVDINTATSTYYFAGEIVASKITITENAANSVAFGANVTIEGDLIMTTTGKHVYIKNDDTSPTCVLDFSGNTLTVSATDTSTGTIILARTTATGNSRLWLNNDVTLACGTDSAQHVYLQRGTTTVMSFAGNSNTVTFAGGQVWNGDVTATARTLSLGAVYSTGTVEGLHKTTASKGSLYKADTSFQFTAYDILASKLVDHTVVFKDGLITSWSVVDH